MRKCLCDVCQQNTAYSDHGDSENPYDRPRITRCSPPSRDTSRVGWTTLTRKESANHLELTGLLHHIKPKFRQSQYLSSPSFISTIVVEKDNVTLTLDRKTSCSSEKLVRRSSFGFDCQICISTAFGSVSYFHLVVGFQTITYGVDL